MGALRRISSLSGEMAPPVTTRSSSAVEQWQVELRHQLQQPAYASVGSAARIAIHLGVAAGDLVTM